MKYDLERMLKEIKEDEDLAKRAADKKLTQEQIRQLYRERKK